MEKDLILKAIKELEENAKLKIDITWTLNKSYDALLTFKNRPFPVTEVEVKKRVLPSMLMGLIGSFKDKPRVLVTEYINPKFGRNLMAENIQFIDTVGNAHLQSEHGIVYLLGQKKRPDLKTEYSTRAFTATGLKVVFYLLCNPGGIQQSYREIANLSQVSLGAVRGVFEGLEKEGFLKFGRQRTRYLSNQAKLLDTWVENYNRTLRPKVNLGRFLSPNQQEFTRALAERQLPLVISGEIAAYLKTKYLKPLIFTLFSRPEDKGEIIRSLRLKKAEGGNIEILEMFWNWGVSNEKNIAHPILIYADLMGSTDSRVAETAKLIYDKYLSDIENH